MAVGPATPSTINAVVEAIYKAQSRRVLATLIRLLGDFERAEEALQDAFAAALAQWPAEGVPDNPRAWLVSAGRFKAIDRLRRTRRHEELLATLPPDPPAADSVETAADILIEDDRLRLVFTCCHPALDADARVALTLREVCGLTTEEVASAFLAKPATIAQRIVRAKRKIRDAGIPYEVPSRIDLPERLDAVLRVIYLVYNEGYSASSGDTAQRLDLAGEAIRLCRLLHELLPAAEVAGLLALMLLQVARRETRCDVRGDLVLLEDQDRSRWDRELIAEGSALVTRALSTPGYGPYAVQAAIAALHAGAATSAATDWAEITGLYDVLLRMAPSPVVELNRAVAVSMLRGPRAGLALVDALLERDALACYHLAHATRAELCRRLGQREDARRSYERALGLVRQAPERRFLEKRLKALEAAR